ncbi:MAG TPA: baseplate J/gp47 family protein [Candidatus Saccharimonadales bacterium]
MKKDTIYIDIEDDITTIIDKVKSAAAKIVAVVPPKRSTTLISAVNMKLLKRTAEESNKQVVLVTSEASLLSLAGGVGLYVAPNLHTKPFLPSAENAPLVDESVIDGAELDPTAPVGELDKHHTTGEASLENEPAPTEPAKNTSKPRFKIPSFDRFRSRFLLIGAAILGLGLLWWWAFFIAPKARITISAQTSSVDTVFEFTADAGLEVDDFEKNQFKAEQVELKQTISQDFTPTGKKNIGEKASGPVEVRNETGIAHTIEAGTNFTSSGGLKFEATESATVPGATVDGGGNVVPGTVDMQLRSVAPGTQYNLAAGEVYDIDGVGSLTYGVGGDMSGGTDKNVTIVAQKDVDAAKKQLADTDRADLVSLLRDEFDDDIVPLNESLVVKIGSAKSEPAVGAEAATAKVTAEASLTMLGLARETLKKAVEDYQTGQFEGGDQIIYRNGLDELVFSLVEKQSNSKMDLRLRTEGFIGPDLDTAQLAEDISGKRFGEAVNIIRSRPGVIEVDADFEPFWVFSAPRPGRIEFILNVNDAAL